MDHLWMYVRSGMLSDEQVGPISEQQLLAEIRSGALALTTQICSTSRTNGQWHQVQQIPGCLQVWQQGQAERDETKRKQALEKQQQRQTAADQKQQQQQVAAEQKRIVDGQRQQLAQQRQAEVAAISDSQDVGLVNTIRQNVEKILTSNEVIQFIAIQKKPVLNVMPDAVIVTNQRLIFFRPKLLGRFEFQDYYWLDVGNAHLEQGIIASTFTARHVSGAILSMEYLSKESAAKLYRIAQEREQLAIELRRKRMMEERQAGATNISVNTNVPEATSARPTQPQSSSGTSDLIARLETLKTMLDRQLISADDYEQRKKQILSQV